jgi:PAS domain S-box-containing protein
MKPLQQASPLLSLLRNSLFPLVATGGLVLLGQYHFLLFHAAAELVSIGIAWALLAVMWHSYDYARNHLLMFLGIGFFWLAGIDLVHTLAYKGMGIFVGYDANLPTQLWVAARLLEALLLLVAPALIQRPIRRLPLFVGGGMLAALVVAAALARLLPDTFIEGQGLTPFKVHAEYLIVFLLGLAALHLYHRRTELEPGLLRALLLVVGFTIISELAFTFYVDLYGLSNQVGHIFKIFAFWVLYVAVIHYPLRQIATAAREQASIAERLRVSEAALQEGNRFIALALDSQRDTFFVFELATGRAIRWNRAFRDISGYADAEIAVMQAPDDYCDAEDLGRLKAALAAAGPRDSIEIELTLIRKDRRRVPIEYSVAFIGDPQGAPRYVITVGRDVTDRKRNLEREHAQLAELRRWQGVMLDREERMMALKGEVNALLARLEEAPRYPPVPAAEGAGAVGPDTGDPSSGSGGQGTATSLPIRIGMTDHQDHAKSSRGEAP